MWGAVVFLACMCIGRISASAESAPSNQPQGSRIVSGWEANEGQFPYMLYVRGVTQFGDIGFCGGSIIHRSWGVSSGRCTARRVYLIINGGMVNLSRPRFNFQTTTVITAPGYIDDMYQITQPHDIALIGFNRELTFDTYVQPIRLQPSAHRTRDYSGVLMTTSGWGTTWTGGETVQNLNWVHLQGVSNFVCLLLHNSNWLVQETTICAGPYNVTTQSICSGDSGVPLTMVEADGVVTQVGVGSFVASWGCHVGFPGGFTRPGFYHDFIREATGINFDWNPAAKDNAANVDHVKSDDTVNVDQVKFVDTVNVDQVKVADTANVEKVIVAENFAY